MLQIQRYRMGILVASIVVVTTLALAIPYRLLVKNLEHAATEEARHQMYAISEILSEWVSLDTPSERVVKTLYPNLQSIRFIDQANQSDQNVLITKASQTGLITLEAQSSDSDYIIHAVLPIAIKGQEGFLIGSFSYPNVLYERHISTIVFFISWLILTFLGIGFVGWISHQFMQPMASLRKQLSKVMGVLPGSVQQANTLQVKDWVAAIIHNLQHTEQLIQLHQSEEQELFLQTILSLSLSVDARDKYTQQHSRNVARYAVLIAKQLGFSEKEQLNIYIGGLLHDIGKIAVPDTILRKSGRLTEEEFRLMKEHTENGHAIVTQIVQLRERGIDDIVLYHHERLDGSGYPLGLQGYDIPLGARIIAVADSYDAMTTARSYRTARSHEFALDQLIQGKGSHYDEQVVEAFMIGISQEHHALLIEDSIHIL